MTQPEFFLPTVSSLREGDTIFVSPSLGLPIPEGTKVLVIDTVQLPNGVYLLVEHNEVGVGNMLSPDTEVELVPPF